MFINVRPIAWALVAATATAFVVSPAAARPGTPDNMRVWNCGVNEHSGPRVCVQWRNRTGREFTLLGMKDERVGFDVDLRINNRQVSISSIALTCNRIYSEGSPCFQPNLQDYRIQEPRNPDHPLNKVFFGFSGGYETDYCVRVRARRKSDDMVSAIWSNDACVRTPPKPTKAEPPLSKPCVPGQVYREQRDGDEVCVHPDKRWVMDDGSCRQGYFKIGVGAKKDTCGTPAMLQKAAKAAASLAKDALWSGNPQDFAGTWNTTRRGENIILTLNVDGNNVAGSFTNQRGENGTLTGTIGSFTGDYGPVVKLSYVSKQPIVGDGSFRVFKDGTIEGGFAWREPGKAKKTYIRWIGTRVSGQAVP